MTTTQYAKARSEAGYRLDWWHHATTKNEQRRRRDARRDFHRAGRRFVRALIEEALADDA